VLPIVVSQVRVAMGPDHGVAGGERPGFDAFISYSHALDGTLAPALQIGLERFAKPWYRSRALRVFRDDASMSASTDLWSSIEQALMASAWLVLMASPDAARSPWVDKEVRWWLKHKSGERLLVVLTEGEFAYIDEREAGPDAALPAGLRGAFAAEPRWVDLRWLHDVGQVAQSNPRLRDGIADVAATVRGVPKDILVGEHIRQHRRTMRLARTAVAVLVVLALAAAAAAFVAYDRQQQADRSGRTATARLLDARADTTIGSDPRTALKLALAAQQVDPGGEAHAGLVASLTATRYAGILSGHRDGVRVLAQAPDRALLASAGNDGTAILWDLHDPARPRQRGTPVRAGEDPVEAVAFDSAGTLLATGSADPASPQGGTIRLWNVADPDRPVQVGSPINAHHGVHALAFAPGRPILVSGGQDHTMIVWDVADPARPAPLGSPLSAHAARVRTVVFGRDAATMISAGDDGQVIVWDLTDPRAPRPLARPLAGQLAAVGALAYSPRSARLVTVALRGVLLWDLSDREHPRQLATLDPGRSASSATFAPDGQTIALGGPDRTTSVWDLTDAAHPRRVDVFAGHQAVVRAVAFSPDGTRLFSGSDDATVLLWDMTDATRPHLTDRPARGPGGAVSALALSEGGRLLATADADGSAALWDLTDPREPQPLGHTPVDRAGPPTALALRNDGHLLATATTDNTIQLWDTTDPDHPRPLGRLRGHQARVSSVVFLPGTPFAVTADVDGAILVWDLTDPDHPRPMPPPPADPNGAAVNALALRPGGGLIAAARDDGTVDLWDLENPAAAHRIRSITTHPGPVNAVAFTPDGRTLAAAGEDGSVALWDVHDPTNAAALGQPLRGIGDWMRAVAFSPDGALLVTGSDDKIVTVFDVSDPARPRRLGDPLTGPLGPAATVTFTPDGRFLAVPGSTDPVLIWDLVGLNDLRAHAVDTACARTGGGLSPSEWSAADIEIIGYQNSCPHP
jgi:WD40 repeat protein